jgi:hypothetical protein
MGSINDAIAGVFGKGKGNAAADAEKAAQEAKPAEGHRLWAAELKAKADAEYQRRVDDAKADMRKPAKDRNPNLYSKDYGADPD